MSFEWGMMRGYVSLILHAHLPFVRHPEQKHFLEESWLFEATTETYIPLLQLLERWAEEKLHAPLTITLTPTLCAMLQDPLLQERYQQRLNLLIELSEQEVRRTRWENSLNELALFYHERLVQVRRFYLAHRGDLLTVFRQWQDAKRIEILTSAATHALLPLLAHHPPSVRAQIRIARDEYRRCFGRDPGGIWLPECAWCDALEPFLREASLHWFIVEAHGLLHARPQPRYGVFAPIITPQGTTAFGRDPEAARQVWSHETGYPGDGRYRDFYRDIGFDLDLEYLRPYLPGAGQRGFTGIKYHRITDRSAPKQIYHRQRALEAAAEHAQHFLEARAQRIRALAMRDQPPVLICPYDAELFGHWWYEGPEFLDLLIRKSEAQKEFLLATPEDYLKQHPTVQVAQPAASSWGEGGYWNVWLNETNEWIYPRLSTAQQRMTDLADRFAKPSFVKTRALRQAGRELLLAQSSDWPFMLRAGTSSAYARTQVEGHLARFNELYKQIIQDRINEEQLDALETTNNLFPELDVRYWKTEPQGD